MKKVLIIAIFIVTSISLMSMILKNSDDLANPSQDKCLKVQYNCDGKVFTEIITGKTYEENKKKAQNKYPNCKMTIINQSCK